jgi:hypothetical protein
VSSTSSSDDMLSLLYCSASVGAASTTASASSSAALKRGGVRSGEIEPSKMYRRLSVGDPKASCAAVRYLQPAFKS